MAKNRHAEYSEAKMLAEMSAVFIHISETAAELAMAMKNYEKMNGGKCSEKCRYRCADRSL